MITTRDIEVIEFLKRYKVASTSTITQLFFPSLSACQKRLKVMYDNKVLKRARDNINAEYIYFVRRPQQMRHSILATQFYAELSKYCTVANYKLEPTLGSIRPDALFGYRYNHKNYIGILEIEISNKGFDINKYLRFYSSKEYQSFLPAMPKIFIVGNNVKPQKAEFAIVNIKEDLSDLLCNL